MRSFNDQAPDDESPRTVLLPMHHHESIAAEERYLHICESLLPHLDGIIMAPACGTSDADQAHREQVIELLRMIVGERRPVVFVDRYMVAGGRYADVVAWARPTGTEPVALRIVPVWRTSTMWESC